MLHGRPTGADTDGKRVVIKNFGFSILPPAGWKTELPNTEEPVNLRFPWFQSEGICIQFAISSYNQKGRSLREGFDDFVQSSTKRGSEIKFTGKSEELTLPSGIKMIRAEFKGLRGVTIIRYFVQNSKGETGFIHLLSYRDDRLPVIEDCVRKTLQKTE